MTLFHLHYSGKISKAEFRTAGDKPICEVSLCKKVPARGQDAERFDWLKVTIWSPPEWAVARLVKGNYITGHGDLSLRPYEKDGVKNKSMEVRSGSFDFEVETLADRDSDIAPAARPAAPSRPLPTRGGDETEAPPFHRSELEYVA